MRLLVISLVKASSVRLSRSARLESSEIDLAMIATFCGFVSYIAD